MTTITTLAAELRAEADPVLRNDGATPYARGIAVGKLNAADRFAELRDESLHELADLHDSLRTVYALIPSLPVMPEDCEQATTALHTLCTAIGIHGVEVAADRLDALAREGWRPIAECPNDLSDAFMARVYGHGIPPDFGIGYCHTSGRPVAYDSCGEQFDPTHFLPPPPTGDA